jgi:Flp pilus assembly protein TadD
VCCVSAIFLGLDAHDASLVREANGQGARGDYDSALATAAKVHRAPAQLGAMLVTARTLSAQGRLPEADAAWAAVARRDPNNWHVHLEWARTIARLHGDGAAALSHYRRARELNPQLPALDARG